MLQDKVAVVTGGSRGIGRAICMKLAQEGASVAFLYAGNTERAEQTLAELKALNAKAACYRCDVSDFAAVSAVFAEIVRDFGTVDILVNNAGITSDKLMLAMKEDDFDRVVGVNLKGAFNTIKQVYPIFARKRSGKIVNITSVAGITGNAGQTNYASAKAGLIGLTKSVARELAGRGICCNAVAPGFIETDMTAGTPLNQQMLAAVPLARMGKPEEVAELVAFLASSKSDYITGSVIQIDGGLAM
ncbi:MAG TPA: 3-oxoacyl-[acyl-carrier-protein] reductase [Oscillospiraceae bacterium]|nr:3-oxoacyl-[acyl-carrier-protein] reductase [Oscillospiraceae bacterium]HPF55578.1 3-oxoacyl-[acyl-carrier-protein] reductase [Clostridiales bacterium]HPK35813.1 3-oxoacyl-[acyl-carrier-protein] reductase [Oscillospiraceae bacterium]HPR76331.1 3-oxoacyl-[acyl-carrier-protein] reductase [Oscillospiraceae bacterium]